MIEIVKTPILGLGIYCSGLTIPDTILGGTMNSTEVWGSTPF